MGISLTHLIILLVVVFVLFGAGKLPQVMGDLGKGLRFFREGMKDSGSQNTKKNASKGSKKSP